MDDIITGADILVAMFHFSNGSGKASSCYSESDFSDFFYAQKQKHPSIFSDINFESRSMEQRSSELRSSYELLMRDQTIPPWGIKFNPSDYVPGCDFAFEKFTRKKLSPQELNEMKLVASEFWKKFSANSGTIEDKLE